MGTKRKTRRGGAGRSRGPATLIVVGVTALVVVALGVGGFLVYRALNPGSSAINLPGLGGPKDKLVGRWETDPQQAGNNFLSPGQKVTYDVESGRDGRESAANLALVS